MRYRGYFLHDIILSHLVLLVSVPPDPGFFHREIDDSEPVVQWSDLSDMESVSEAGLRNRNPFIMTKLGSVVHQKAILMNLRI